VKRKPRSLIVFFWIFVLAAYSSAQIDKINIPAGTPEDRDLQAISNQRDAAKKLAMYLDFVQKYSSNPAAVAYGNWQISQAYQTSGDLNKALDYGDKALAGAPRNLDILVSQASVAQQAKNNQKLIDCASRGGEVCSSIGKQPKPDGMTDDDFSRQVAEERSAAKNSCDFLESAGFNVIASETDAKSRMAYIEKYSAAFLDSKFQDQVSNYALYTLGPGQLNDQARLIAYGEKTLAANPNALPALLLMAGAYVDDSKAGSVGKASAFSAMITVPPHVSGTNSSNRLTTMPPHRSGRVRPSGRSCVSKSMNVSPASVHRKTQAAAPCRSISKPPAPISSWRSRRCRSSW